MESAKPIHHDRTLGRPQLAHGILAALLLLAPLPHGCGDLTDEGSFMDAEAAAAVVNRPVKNPSLRPPRKDVLVRQEPQDQPLDPQSAGMQTRFLAYLSDGAKECPKAGDFRVQPLFAARDNSGPLPPGLAPYCLYERPGTIKLGVE